MNFKKFIIATLTAFALILLPFTFQSARAEDLTLGEHIEILSSGYNTALSVSDVNRDNNETLYDSTGKAVLSAEAIMSQVTTEEYEKTYREMHSTVFDVFKRVVTYQLKNSFDKDEYSSSENGIKRIEGELSPAIGEVELALTYDEVVSSAQSFYNFINYTSLSKKTTELSSKEDNAIKAKVICESFIFATDDVLTVNDFTDSLVIADTISANSKHEDLLSKPNLGIARYISIRWLRDGVVVEGNNIPKGEDEEGVPVTFSIDTASLGLNTDDFSSLQIVRYIGEGQVEILNGVSVTEDNQIQFTLNSFGDDIEGENDLDFAILLDGYALNDNATILKAGYNYLLDFYAKGGVISDDDQEELLHLTKWASESAETLKTLVTQSEYDRNYRNQYVDVFRVFKNVTLYNLNKNYNESDYSPSDGGVVLLHEKLYEARGKISTATSVKDVDDAYQEFIEFISSGDLSKKTNELSTDKEQIINVTVKADSSIFADDDVLTTKKFLDSVIIKNTKIALIDNENLLDPTSGVAYFFSIRWVRDGVIIKGDEDTPTKVTFKVDTSQMGITVDDSSCMQIVRYLGNQEVAFVNASLADGKIVFSLDNFGGDIESNYDLDFAVVIKGYKLEAPSMVGKFINENMVIVISVASAIVILYLLIKIIKINSRRRKRRQYKQFRREYRAFTKYKKKQKKEKKLLKKQMRFNKKQKRIDLKQKRLENKARRKQEKLERNKINIF